MLLSCHRLDLDLSLRRCQPARAYATGMKPALKLSSL